MKFLGKFWFLALIWFAVSIIASIITYSVNGAFGAVTHLTIYYTPLKFLFFPTLLTYFIAEPSTGYFNDMILNHIISVPVYLVLCYVINLAIKKLKRD